MIKVILDAGHYEGCPGKRSPILDNGDLLFEWKFTKELQERIYKLLNDLGYTCYMIPQYKTLTERANAVNKIVDNKCILVSIHGNAAPGDGWSSANGWEVWTTTKKNNSDKLAQCFIEEFPKVFPDKKLRGAKEEDFTLLYKANCPCVLTENFFYNNKEECKYMLSEGGKKKIVDLHVKSIINYNNLI